ncbi:hypothetical protein AVENLUH5627_00594 [Acinetobacter venetianus]|uniref:DUF3565 domain-containing protein n=1 Tax=Acinetobacter venetianus TaxID=52133 RepID=A0A150I1H8_9GAMM|nr:hypothetical protein AVENLUH5627_00594 [Acinetobacter venetianus]
MQQAIVGFHLDDQNHWVADLACGHTQHVRHDPPWQNRPWVLTEQGRKEKLGVMLECKKCEEVKFVLSNPNHTYRRANIKTLLYLNLDNL